MPDAYASHLPVLTALINTDKPSRVLEFGAGLYSTPLFLEKCEYVVSVEKNADWFQRIAIEYPDANLVTEPPSIANFDLIFIDDGENDAERCETIVAVLSRPHPMVVIHDAEVESYAEVIDGYAVNYSIFPTDPDTAVILATNT